MKIIKDKSMTNVKNTTGVASRKERERQVKKKDILKAAREVFAQKGLHAATLDEIAEKAEFAKGTLYGYFSSKENLFISVVEEEMINFREKIKDVLIQDITPDQTIALLVVTMLQIFDQNIDLLRLMNREQLAVTTCADGIVKSRFRRHYQKMVNMVSEHIAHGIELNQFHALNPNQVAIAIFSLCHGVAINSFMNRKKIYNTDNITLITNLLLDGIKTRN